MCVCTQCINFVCCLLPFLIYCIKTLLSQDETRCVGVTCVMICDVMFTILPLHTHTQQFFILIFEFILSVFSVSLFSFSSLFYEKFMSYTRHFILLLLLMFCFAFCLTHSANYNQLCFSFLKFAKRKTNEWERPKTPKINLIQKMINLKTKWSKNGLYDANPSV